MHFDDTDRAALKQWVVPKLEKVSDADAGVLADYVIALIAAEDSEEAVRQNCLEALPDFLHDNTGPFIEEVLTAVKDKSYNPTASNGLTPSLNAEAPAFNPPTGPSFNPPTGPSAQTQSSGHGAAHNGRGEQSRKRRFNDRDPSVPREGADSHHGRSSGNDRPVKQVARRGGRNSRGGFGGPASTLSRPTGFNAQTPVNTASFPALPTLPPGFPFDPSDPMALFALMSANFGAMNMPLPFTGMPQNRSGGQLKSETQRCRDYDTKGYCARGGACSFEHGGELVLPPEYDPNQSSLAVRNGESSNGNPRASRSRNRNDFGANGRAPGGRGRAPFSMPGPSFDRANSTIVVEQIPEENFSEEDVRGFFSQFGNIVDVSMQAYKHLAIVKYDDHYAARRAYDSPKVIFENRFVKVYWYKADAVPTPPSKSGTLPDGPMNKAENDDEQMYDAEAIEKRQAEAQKAFEERQKKVQEADARMEEIDRQLRAKDEEMRKLRQELAKKSKGAGDSDLIDQLSSLQAEAQDLANAEYGSYVPRGRGRGGYRGRGFYEPRGRVYSSYGGGYRGGYRGRGFNSAPFMGGRSGVKRLDNRPKRIAVSGVERGSPQDEALRQYLLSNFEFDSIDTAPDRNDTQIITFKERYIAEMFLESAAAIPDIGKIELAWVANTAHPTATPSTKPDAPPSEHEPTSDTKAEEGETESADGGNGVVDSGDLEPNGNENADYDVADDEDRWMAP